MVRVAAGVRIETIPSWVYPPTRAYLQGDEFPINVAVMQFGHFSADRGPQVVWTRTEIDHGPRARFGRWLLREIDVFEFYPRERSFYEGRFTMERSRRETRREAREQQAARRLPRSGPTPPVRGAAEHLHRSARQALEDISDSVHDATTSEDDLWEALYSTYQLYNRDMQHLVVERGFAPRDARGELHRLDREIHTQVMAAMLKLSTSYVPGTGPATGADRVAGVFNQVVQQIAQRLGADTSLSSAIIESYRRGRTSTFGSPPPLYSREPVWEIEPIEGEDIDVSPLRSSR